MATNDDGGVILTPEEIKVLIKERDEFKGKRDELQTSLNNVVDEVKSMRKTKQELEHELETLKKISTDDKPAVPNIDDIIQEKLNSKLSEMTKEQIAQEESKAWEEFISMNPEFSKDVDTSGLRMETFKRELGRFNTSGARRKEDFLGAMQDAITLLYRKENKEYTSPYASSPSRGGAPAHDDGSSLTKEEKETMQRLGWDAKKFTEMKLKHPDLYASVFKK